MKLRPRRRKASESTGREVKLRMPLKKPKEKAGTRLNRRSVKSGGLVKKNDEGESNQVEDPGPSRPACSRRQVSTVSRSSVSNIEIGPGSGVALFLEEVLEHIFGFLTFADVKSARLVNKHWRQVSTTLLRRSSKEINMDQSVSDCINKTNDGQFPVNRFCIYLDDPKQQTICSMYFPGICAWVKELTLTVDINKPSPSQVLNNMVAFPTDCIYKGLTHFDLQLIQRTNLIRVSWEPFRDFVRSIVENSPNLREVNVACESALTVGAEMRAVCPVIENVFPISNSVGASKLSYINFARVPLEKIDLAKWSTLNLKLRKLGLNVSRFSKPNELLEKFLETQSGTLKELTLNLSHCWDYKAPAGTFAFPRLEKLEKLRVTCYSKFAPVTFGGIDYARLFPCLKKLDLKYDEANWNWRDFLGNDLLEPTNTVEELIFPYDLHPSVDLTPNPAVIAAQVFTGLKKLEIEPDRLFTEAVYENMPNLEVLIFYYSFSKTYDHIITSLGLEVCNRFRGVMTKTWIKKLQNVEGRSMARLQNLKTLKLTKCRVNWRLHISRLSLHVFKKMSSLKCLDLFQGCAETADRWSANATEDQKQFLEELRANFVIL